MAKYDLIAATGCATGIAHTPWNKRLRKWA